MRLNHLKLVSLDPRPGPGAATANERSRCFPIGSVPPFALLQASPATQTRRATLSPFRFARTFRGILLRSGRSTLTRRRPLSVGRDCGRCGHTARRSPPTWQTHPPAQNANTSLRSREAIIPARVHLNAKTALFWPSQGIVRTIRLKSRFGRQSEISPPPSSRGSAALPPSPDRAPAPLWRCRGRSRAPFLRTLRARSRSRATSQIETRLPRSTKPRPSSSTTATIQKTIIAVPMIPACPELVAIAASAAIPTRSMVRVIVGAK